MVHIVTVEELLDGHAVLDIECLDRVYLNAYVPILQSSGQVVAFMTHRLGMPIPSPALVEKISAKLRRAVDSFAICAATWPGEVLGSRQCRETPRSGVIASCAPARCRTGVRHNPARVPPRGSSRVNEAADYLLRLAAAIYVRRWRRGRFRPKAEGSGLRS
jgi:hypothetical protein